MRTEAQVDALLAEAAARIRAPKPGEVEPAVEYDWAQHAWLVGAKSRETKQWVLATTMGGPIGSPVGLSLHDLAIYFQHLADQCREKAA